MINNIETALRVEYLPVDTLKSYVNNARTHSLKQIGQIADSIRAFGFNTAVLIDRNNTIIAGHGKVAAARKLGMESVPTIRLEHLTEDQKRAYILADNKLAEQAGWDQAILAIELQHLTMIDKDFDVTITGFELPEIDFIIQGAPAKTAKEDVFIADEKAPVITRSGELWELGNHFIYCGNSLEEKSFREVMGNEKAQVVFTDPPYNVPIQGNVSGLGKVTHDEFAMASGEMAPEAFTKFLGDAFKLLTRYSIDGSIQYVCMDWRHGLEILTAGKGVYSELKNVCVWNKDNGGMGALYRSKHEFVYVFKHGTAPHINNVELGANGRYRTNVWDYPGQNSLHAKRDTELAMHPTVKPVTMVADALLDCSHRGGLVLDPFGGSGTTLLAAEKTGRKARLIEMEPRYVDVTIRRWQELSRKEAKAHVTGESFNARAKAVMEASHGG